MKRVPPLLLHGPFTHQTDRAQYVADIDRYAFMRRVRIDYRQVTKEHLAAPRNLVRMVHRLLVDNGYDGPPPDVGMGWERLFRRLRDLEKCRRPRSTRGGELGLVRGR